MGMRCRLNDLFLGKFQKILKELWPFAIFGNFYIEILLARYIENYLS